MSPMQWMLALLGADNGSPVCGKTVFLKQLFVVGKELIPQVDEDFRFFPHKYGPYSRVFEKSLEELRVSGSVVEEARAVYSNTSPEKIRKDYQLTPSGTSRARQTLEQLPLSLRREMDEYKRYMSRMGFWGLIHYVYKNYPQYTGASQIDIGQG